MRGKGKLAMPTKHKVIVFIVLILLVLSSGLVSSQHLRAKSNPCGHHTAAKSADCKDDGQVGNQDEGQLDNVDDAQVGNQDKQKNEDQKHGEQGKKGDQQGENND
jgi:hypothetical protein